ncbi:hypothetical protein MLD38_009821 [Melastoma candidum]|uniref:Uncharacterized protein n=1 Tax=Melastoma candidum TaxID=119954 RepID=A0ACB9RZB4_9MYRT|nr:hypothetical protein MLD38_009821 [Melastoma candidum]
MHDIFGLLITFFFLPPSFSYTFHNVRDFGADPTGTNDSSQSFLAAWSAACNDGDPTSIWVLPGTYLIQQPVKFSGPCRSPQVGVKIMGNLTGPSDYRALGDAPAWVSFHEVDNLYVNGGTFDARGPALWACKDSGTACPDGTTTVSFTNCNHLRIKDLVSIDSQKFHVSINRCQNVRVIGVRISADGNSPNTDGIHVQLSTNVVILHSAISTGDDCISIGPGTRNLKIEHIRCGPGHGISIGSLAKDSQEPGVENILVKNVLFVNTQNGVRIKSWARPSSGFVRGIRFVNAGMLYAHNPIIIDQNYCPQDATCPDQGSSVRISDVVYKNIWGVSATPTAVRFNCSSEVPCSRIRMKNILLLYMDEVAMSACANAIGEAYGAVQPSSCLDGAL